MNLTEWSDETICVTEGGEQVERIRLVLEGETYGTWPAVGWDPERGERFFQSLLEELPARKHEACWIAETREGIIRGQLPRLATGRSRLAAKTQETAHDAMTRAVARLLDATDKHLHQQSETVELLLKQNRLLMEQCTNLRPKAGEMIGEAVAGEIGPIAKELPALLGAVASYLKKV